MNTRTVDRMKQLCSRLGLSELPMGVYFTGREPESGFTPQVLESPSREREQRGEVDWPAVFQGFSCVMGHVWRARRKRSRAWFSAEQYGCPGGSFWLGFHKPQTEAIIHYVSTGIPGLEESCTANPRTAFGRPLRPLIRNRRLRRTALSSLWSFWTHLRNWSPSLPGRRPCPVCISWLSS